MNGIKIVASILIVAGIVSLAYGGFSYTKETHETNIGSMEISVTEKESVDLPIWSGIGVILIGGSLLLYDRKKS